MANKLIFGLRDKQLLHISEVDKGLKCNCICPFCSSSLVARKGDKTSHHFVHKNNMECSESTDVAFHMAARDFFRKNKKIVLPPVHFNINQNSKPLKLRDTEEFIIDDVTLENKLEDKIPEVILYIKEHQLLVLVTVTGNIDKVKAKRIFKLGIPTIGINLSKINKNTSLDELEKIIIYDTDNKEWLYNRNIKLLRNKLEEASVTMPVIKRGFASHVDNCPINSRVWKGKVYANLCDDCFCCNYMLSFRQDDILQIENRTIEAIKDHISHEKLEFISSLKHKSFLNYELEKKLTGAGFTKEEINLVFDNVEYDYSPGVIKCWGKSKDEVNKLIDRLKK